MSNAIDGLNGHNRHHVTDSRNKAQSDKTGVDTADRLTANTTGHPSTDTVDLTDSARQLKEMERGLAERPHVDAAKVANIKAQIADGSYEVDAQRIANKLIEAEKSLP